MAFLESMQKMREICAPRHSNKSIKSHKNVDSMMALFNGENIKAIDHFPKKSLFWMGFKSNTFKIVLMAADQFGMKNLWLINKSVGFFPHFFGVNANNPKSSW